MKQRSILWQAAGFAHVTFGGTILHFLYDWTGGSILVSPFSGVNESTWEHMETVETRVLKSSFSGLKGAKKDLKMFENSSTSYLEARCRRFESCRPDHIGTVILDRVTVPVLF